MKRSVKANMLMSIALSRPLFAALHTVKASEVYSKGQVVSQRLHSNSTYEYNYSVGDRLGVRGRGLHACVYVGVACVYNCQYTRAPYVA